MIFLSFLYLIYPPNLSLPSFSLALFPALPSLKCHPSSLSYASWLVAVLYSSSLSSASLSPLLPFFAYCCSIPTPHCYPSSSLSYASSTLLIYSFFHHPLFLPCPFTSLVVPCPIMFRLLCPSFLCLIYPPNLSFPSFPPFLYLPLPCPFLCASLSHPSSRNTTLLPFLCFFDHLKLSLISF